MTISASTASTISATAANEADGKKSDVMRWDIDKGTWTAVSGLGGGPMKR